MIRDTCPVCEAQPERFGAAIVLGKFAADFLRCRNCGAIFVEHPTWLPEAYETAIAERDIGLVSRNVVLAGATRRVLRTFFPQAGSFLDFGAGTGMFVRLMRDSGYEFRYFDQHGPNLYARGLECEDPGAEEFDVVTAMEVLEHLEQPIHQLRHVVSGSQAFLATTVPLPSPPPRLGQWWYYSLATGQHITFFSHRALDVLSERFSFTRSSAGPYHVFARRTVPPRLLRFVASERLGAMAGRFGTRPSLLSSDYQSLTGESLGSGGAWT
jgi:Methyltransferase domain